MTLATAVMANGVNFTDGFDTLSTIPLLTNFLFLALIAYISSRPDWSAYFLIPQINGVQEMVPLIGAVMGVLLAFLWFNAPPSEIIMGDSGSIGLGGMIGIMFVFVKAEFYLPIIGFIFLIEFASSFIQIFWYKLTKTRVFRMAPIHHHFQIILRESKKYNREGDIRSKITWQFHIISIILFVVGTVLYLKVR
jgi:phospho-N-acetylmuramoyl-pentapeptide-transferase